MKHKKDPNTSQTSSSTSSVRTRKKRFPSSLLAVSALMLALAPTAQADVVPFTTSTQLNLDGRDVLAAVNFYAPTNRPTEGTPGHVVVGSIQGQAFTNFDENDWTSILPTPFSHTVTQGTLTMSGNSKGGRESTDGANGYEAITGPDNTEANKLGGAGWFSGAIGQDNDMDFAFGIGNAGRTVEVQMIGGGTSQKNRLPIWTVLVGGDEKGVFISGDGSAENNGAGENGNPYLMTFTTTLDASGDLFIDVDYSITDPGAGDISLMGVMVTAGALPVPEPTSMALLALGGLGLLLNRRRRRRS